MDPRLETLFAAALDMTPSQRTAYLGAHCADAPELRRELEELLHCHDRAGDLLEKPACLTDAPHETPPALGDRYVIHEVLGRGAMGIVYRAEQVEPVRREVALKVMATELDSVEARARFEAERQAIALVDHVHVARLYDAGTTEDGRSWFAMELVAGRPIHVFCAERRLTLRDRVELLTLVCRAVHHAHQKGVVHRDLKPSNVLVVEADGRPQPKVIDFGVAKAFAQGLRHSFTTERGELLGTLEYMSPEQAGATADVDTRADIYSIGVMLYELLTDALPFDSAHLRSLPLAEALRIVREEDPRPPSMRVAERSALRELDWIVLKAMEKDRNRRYASAAEMAEDLVRFLRDEPVIARPPTARYRLAKLFRRHRVAVLAGSAIVLSLTGGLVATLHESARAREQRDLAIASEQVAAQNLRRAIDATAFSLSFMGETLSNVAGATAARRQQAEATLETLEQLAALPNGGAAAEPGLAYALQRLGEAQQAMGDSEAALLAFRRAYEIRLRLQESENGPAQRRQLAVGHWKMSEALVAMGRLEEAERHDLAAHDLHRGLARVSTARDNGIYLGISLRRLADIDRERGRIDSARARLEEALALLEQGLADSPDYRLSQLNRAMVLSRLGKLLISSGNPSGAGVMLAAAEASLRDQVAAAEPSTINERRELARCLLARSDLELESGEPARALDSARAAAATARAMCDVDPLLYDIRHLQAQALLAEASALAALGNDSETALTLRSALEHLEILARHEDNNAWVACDLARALLLMDGLAESASRERARQILLGLEADGRLPPSGSALLAGTGG